MGKVKVSTFVPVEERPYEVPENWVWTRLGNVAKIVGGGTPSTNVVEYYERGNISWISPADLSNYESIYISRGRKNITQIGLEKSSARLMPKNSVLLSSRAPIGYVAIAKNELCTNQGFKSFLPSPIYKPEYLYFYLKSIKETLESYASGTTFLELSASKAALVVFPLPPLPEQHRIVARIESLFAKLDRTKELAQSSLDSFETRKAAILHKAFTGELTAKWREENGVGMDSWEEKQFIDITTKITDGFHNTPEPVKKGYPYVMARHIKPNGIDYFNGLYMDEKNHRELFNKAQPQKGDILLVNIGAGTGTPAIIDVDFEFSFKNSAILKLNQFCERGFMFYYLLMIQPRVLSEITRGGAQPFLSLKILKSMEISVPTLAEQQEIVRILDSLFEKEKRARELCDVIGKIDLVKKAILARAFRGELGTNDPSEERASY